MPDIALLALVLVAMIIGYFFGWRDQRKRQAKRAGQPSKEYFVGLNYLLNEQTDQAIDVFIKALDTDNDTVDTCLALGSVFGKRGEVEKSIRVHQDLLARPSLTSSQCFQVQLALAQNYSAAGLLDRAEAILTDLVRQKHPLLDRALQQLLKIYEREREWHKAIDVAQRLKKNGAGHYGATLAHFYCEQGETAIQHNDKVLARRLISHAFAQDKQSVRASLLLGQMEFDAGNYKLAIKALQRISTQDISFVPVSLPLLEKAFEASGSLRGFVAYLERCLGERPGTAVIVTLSRLLCQQAGEPEAVSFLSTQLERHPTLRGLHELIGLRRQSQVADDELLLIHHLTGRLLELKPVFSCAGCGFSGKEMHWQCPRCHCWGSIKPIQGFEGE